MTHPRKQTIAVLNAMRQDLYDLIRQINTTLRMLQGELVGPQRPYDAEPSDAEAIAAKHGIDLDPGGEIPDAIAERIRQITGRPMP